MDKCELTGCLEAERAYACACECAGVRVRTLTLVSRWPRGDREYIYMYKYVRIQYPLDVSPGPKYTSEVKIAFIIT